jgi:hypothetical protein
LCGQRVLRFLICCLQLLLSFKERLLAV